MLCVKKLSFSLALALIGMIAVSPAVRAEESNQTQVRANIAKGGWDVYYGEKITEAEYLKLTAAIVASVASANPGPVVAMLHDYIDRTVVKLKAKFPKLSESVIRQMIAKAITARDGSSRVGQIDLKFGIATYNRWQKVVYNEPRTRRVQKEKTVLGKKVKYWVVEAYTERVEKTINLPNWHDPYIAVRVR